MRLLKLRNCLHFRNEINSQDANDFCGTKKQEGAGQYSTRTRTSKDQLMFKKPDSQYAADDFCRAYRYSYKYR